MALNGVRLKGVLTTDIAAQLQAIFPTPAGLQAAEQIADASSRTKLAQALANAIGPDTVTEITANAVVPGIVIGGATTTVT